jgi:hypothetical protein
VYLKYSAEEQGLLEAKGLAMVEALKPKVEAEVCTLLKKNVLKNDID